MLHNIKTQLDTHYKCTSTPKPYCSDYELAAKQWMNSSVTMKLPPSLDKILKQVDTFHKWDKDVKAF